MLHQGAVNGLAFACRFLLLRTLGVAFLPEDYGVYVIIGTFLAFGLQIVGLYLNNYMTWYVPGKPLSEQMTLLKTFLAFELPLAGLAVGLAASSGLDRLLLAHYGIERHLWAVRLAGLLLLFDVALVELLRYHYAVKRIEVANVMEFLGSCSWVFPVVAFWSAGWSITLPWLFTAWLGGVIAGIGYGVWRLERDAFRAARVNWKLLKPALVFSLPIMLAATGDRLLFLADRWLLAFFQGLESVGHYGYAFALINILSAFISTAVTGVMGPYIMEAHNLAKYRERDALLAAMLKYSLLLVTYGLLVLVVYGEAIMGWLARAEYRGSGELLLWLAPIAVLTALTTPAAKLLFIEQKTLMMVVISGTGILMSVLLNLLLIPSYGSRGAAVATALALAGMTALRYWAARSENPIRWRSSCVAEIMLACTSTGAVFFVLNRWVSPNGPLLLLASGLGMGAVYALLLVTLRVVGPREWDMIAKWWTGPVVSQHLRE
jgi:O-antigen/teichoic acid export membrane protein